MELFTELVVVSTLSGQCGGKLPSIKELPQITFHDLWEYRWGKRDGQSDERGNEMMREQHEKMKE